MADDGRMTHSGFSSDAYKTSVLEAEWCEERRAEVIRYLEAEGVTHGRVGDWPAWRVAPYISIWAIESVARPEWVGWWVICGDLPTDYISSHSAGNPREVVRAFARQWAEVADCMILGVPHRDTTIGSPEEWPDLGPLLRTRADLLAGFAEDDSIWDYESER